MHRILAIDPGESSGWFMQESHEDTVAFLKGTIVLDRVRFWELLVLTQPNIIIYEEFKLYPHKARALIGNTFYTCEIIGLIKLYADIAKETKLFKQGASGRKYVHATTQDPNWLLAKELSDCPTTNHTFDAYQHFCMFMHKNKNLVNEVCT